KGRAIHLEGGESNGSDEDTQHQPVGLVPPEWELAWADTQAGARADSLAEQAIGELEFDPAARNTAAQHAAGRAVDSGVLAERRDRRGPQRGRVHGLGR